MSRGRLLAGIVLVAFGAAILAVAAVLLPHSPTAASQPKAPDLSFFPAVKAAMASRIDGETTTLSAPADFALWWIDTGGLAITNDASPATEFRAAMCETDDIAQDGLHALIRQLVPAIDDVMQAHGFTRNVRNSSRSISDDRFYDFIRAYERAGVKAVFSASPDCWSRTGVGPMYYSLTFAYTTDFDANARAQRTFLRDLSLKSDVVIHVAKREGPWAVIDVNYRRTGHYIIAKRISGRWMQVFAGQDMPGCDVVHTWGIPATITPCYATPA